MGLVYRANPNLNPNPNPSASPSPRRSSNQANCCDASEAYLRCAPEGRADPSLATAMERCVVPVDKATLPRPASHAHQHPTSHVPSPPPTCPPHLPRALPAHNAQLRGLGARRARRRERRSDAGAQRQRPPGVQPGGLCTAASHCGAAAGRCGAWPARLVGGGLVAYCTNG